MASFLLIILGGGLLALALRMRLRCGADHFPNAEPLVDMLARLACGPEEGAYRHGSCVTWHAQGPNLQGEVGVGQEGYGRAAANRSA